jgi:chloramphenicol 3-O-phosphotransferase
MSSDHAKARVSLLVYLYGPPAAGKLTIAEKVRDLTGFGLFHNHLTVNVLREVFDFGSPPFVELLHRVRLDVFATAMRAGVSVIFTNNSAWGGPDGRERFEAFADEAARVVASAGGMPLFVRVTAPLEVLEGRLTDPSRRAHGKLVDVARLRELVAGMDDPRGGADDLTIDTSEVTVAEAAQAIAAAAESTGAPTPHM